MVERKLSTVILSILFLLIAVPILAVRDRDNDDLIDDEDYTQEIDNYDFLYEGGEYMAYDGSYGMVGDIMSEAFRHIGARYRAGKSGPGAFDCSGFTKYVFGHLGFALGASSSAQYGQGRAVAKGDLQAGDLVFFTSPGSGRSIGHVGIVTEVDPASGSFEFIHASSSHGVTVSSSSEGYYARRYVGARRMF